MEDGSGGGGGHQNQLDISLGRQSTASCADDDGDDDDGGPESSVLARIRPVSLAAKFDCYSDDNSDLGE